MLVDESTIHDNPVGVGFGRTEPVTDSDLPMLMATALLAATAIVVFSIIVDVLYAVIDPRVRLS